MKGKARVGGRLVTRFLWIILMETERDRVPTLQLFFACNSSLSTMVPSLLWVVHLKKLKEPRRVRLNSSSPYIR